MPSNSYKQFLEQFAGLTISQKIAALEAKSPSEIGPFGRTFLGKLRDPYHRVRPWTTSSVAGAFARTQQSTLFGMTRRPTLGLTGSFTGTPRTGRVLTGRAAWEAVRRTQAEATERFGDVMGYLGRETQSPELLYDALRQAMGGKGRLVFKETPVGGMASLRLGSDVDIDIPTPHGPYMVMPSRDAPGGATLLASGTYSKGSRKEQLELVQLVADEIRGQTDLADKHVREIRSRLMSAMGRFRGGDEVALLTQATGTAMDFLKMNRGTSAKIQSIIADYESRGEFISIDDATNIALQQQKLGYHPIYGKAESLMAGVAPLQRDPTRIFPQLVAGGKPLYQDVAFASVLGQDVSRYEAALFGRKMPRIRTAEAAIIEKAWGAGRQMEQGVVSKLGFVTPEHKLFRQMAGNLSGIEQVIISKELSQQIRYIDKVSGQVRHLGVGTPLKVAGQSVIVGGVKEAAEMEGRHLLMSAKALDKMPDRAAQLLLGDALYEAWSRETRRLPRGVAQAADARSIGTFNSSGIKGVSGRGQHIIFTPNEKLAKMGFGTVIRKIRSFAQRITGRQAGKPNQGIVDITGEFGIRGGMQDLSFTGIKASSMDFMSMATAGPANREVAHQMLKRARQLKGHAAQGFFAFFGAFAGKDINRDLIRLGKRGSSAGYSRFRPGQLSAELVPSLRGIRTAADLSGLLTSGVLPDTEMVLKLPKAIKLPTAGYFREGGQAAFTEVSEIALPPVRRLEGLLKKLSAGAVGTEALKEVRAFIPEYTKGVARVIEAAQQYELNPTSTTERALQRALYEGGETAGKPFKGLLRMLSEHTGGGRLLSRVMEPHFGKAAYTRIAKGWGSALGGLPEVGLGEIGVSEKLARKLGFTNKEIAAALKGEFVPVGQQYWPSIVPESQAVKRLRIIKDAELKGLGRDAWKVIATNEYDLLAAFRDTDYDPTKIFRFEGLGKIDTQAAWEEHRTHIRGIKERIDAVQSKTAAWWHGTGEPVPQSPLARVLGVASEDELRSLLAQKKLAGKHHGFVRDLQAIIETQGLGKGRSARASRALGTVYQMAGIKKGKAGDVGENIITTLRNISATGDLEPSVQKITKMLQDFGPAGAASDVFLGFSPEQYSSVAQDIATAAQKASHPDAMRAARAARFVSGGGMDEGSILEWVTSLAQRGGQTGDIRADQAIAMANVGRTVRSPGAAEAAALAAEQNTAVKAEGAAAKDAGGMTRRLWSDLPAWGKWTLGIAGGLVGLRIAKSIVAGDEPDLPPPPPQPSGAPLPPQPLGLQAGLHQGLAPGPMPQFNAPTARVISPLQRSPSVTISATAPQGMDMSGLGESIAMAASSPAGSPLAGVYSSGVSDTSRIDMNIAEDMRMSNRLYA